jgi:hypothetical protein
MIACRENQVGRGRKERKSKDEEKKKNESGVYPS